MVEAHEAEAGRRGTGGLEAQGAQHAQLKRQSALFRVLPRSRNSQSIARL
jgi:hypothetical protein